MDAWCGELQATRPRPCGGTWPMRPDRRRPDPRPRPVPRNGAPPRDAGSKRAPLPIALKIYIGAACAAAAAVIAVAVHHAGSAHPSALAALMLITLLASVVKVEIPVSGNASTLTACHVIDLIALVMYGADVAVIVAAWGAWTQCTFRNRLANPLYQTVFSVASLALTQWISGAAFTMAGGRPAGVASTLEWNSLAAGATTAFLVNSAL